MRPSPLPVDQTVTGLAVITINNLYCAMLPMTSLCRVSVVSTGEAFVDSLPASVRQKLPSGCSSSEGLWTVWLTTASDSSAASDLAVSLVLCGTVGSSSLCPLVDEESHAAAKQRRSLEVEQKQTTGRCSAASVKSFKPSATDKCLVSC